MSNRREQEAKAPGQYGNQAPQEGENRPSGQDRQEQYQRTRDQAPTDQDGQMDSVSAPPDPDNNLGRGAPSDREDRIRQRAHELWEAEGRPEGQADRHWSRAAEDLDREDAAIQREGMAGEKPGVRPKGDADFVREKS
jgi:hypothetical protein